MADEDYTPIPEEISDKQLSHTASWNNAFPAGDNLAQRSRRQADSSRIAAFQQAEQARHQADALQTSRDAQSLYFGQKKLEMAQQTAQAQMSERDMRMQHEEELHPLKLDAMKAKAAADAARERSLIGAAALKEKIAARTASDDSLFQTTLQKALDSGIKHGTPEWTETVARARLASPGMTTSFFDDMKASTTTMGNLSPEEVVARADAAKLAAGEGAGVSVNSKGGVSVTRRPERAQKPADTPEVKRKNLDGLMRTWNAAKKDPETAPEFRQYLEDRIKEMQSDGVLEEVGFKADVSPDERVSVISPDGKPGRIPKSQLDAAVAAGYKAK